MKKILLITLCLMLIGVRSFSGQPPKSALFDKNVFDVGLQVSYLTYNEPHTKTKGMMCGLIGSYTYHDDIMLKSELRLSYGGVDWSGSTLNGTRVTAHHSLNLLGEVRELGGYDFPMLTASIITPYAGIGLRYLNNDVLPKPYERESYYIYSPLGMGFITDLGNNWYIGESAEYDYFWWGYHTTHPMDDLPGLHEDIISYQRNGYGLRGSITLEKKYVNVAFKGGPFINYWNINKLHPQTLSYTGSPMGFVWQEPGNNSLEVGIELGLKY